MQFPRDYSDFSEDEILEEVHTYLGMWRSDEDYTDVNLMLDKGLTHLAAYTLSQAGAIDSSQCFEWATATEREIERIVEGYTKEQRESDLEDFWQETRCWIDDSNEHYFINSEIHFVDDAELREWGFKPSEEVHAKG
jgi:hypothetical protein